jgi:hypothetical protein
MSAPTEKDATIIIYFCKHPLNGQVFKSLSAAARHITGTRWNGPKFFGLRDGKEEARQ